MEVVVVVPTVTFSSTDSQTLNNNYGNYVLSCLLSQINNSSPLGYRVVALIKTVIWIKILLHFLRTSLTFIPLICLSSKML